MSSHPENLAAWLDDELPALEAGAVTRHVEACAECRARARSYAGVSRLLVEARPPAGRRLRITAWIGAAAAAAVLAIVLWPRSPAPQLAAEQPAPRPSTRVAAAAVHPAPAAVRPVATTARRRLRPQAAVPLSNVAYRGPVIRISLPADELFAPGAVPPGMTIYADVTLGADGSPRELRLLP